MGLTRAHGVFYKGETKDSGKVGGKAFIIKEEVTDKHWKDHIEGNDPSLGIIPIRDDATCSWSCIDVDDYSIDVRKTMTTLHKIKFTNYTLPIKVGRISLIYFLQ